MRRFLPYDGLEGGGFLVTTTANDSRDSAFSRKNLFGNKLLCLVDVLISIGSVFISSTHGRCLPVTAPSYKVKLDNATDSGTRTLSAEGLELAFSQQTTD